MRILILVLIIFSATAFAKDRHFCEPNRTNISCDLEVALLCGDGYIDGCRVQRTSAHRCILKNEGPACQLEIAILCPEGFMDGCESGRTTRHQCVPVAGPSCSEAFSCPDGFIDSCDG